MTSPAVSVTMPVLSPHPRYFPEAVASILRQTFTDFELHVIEAPPLDSPPSQEGVGGVAAKMLAPFGDARVRHILMDAPTTLVDQRNRGLHEARAELVALMDADDVCEPDRLAVQLAYLQQHPEITVLGSRIQIIDEQGQPLGYRDYPLEHEEIVRTMPSYNPIAQPSVMLRKTPVLAAGGYQYRYQNVNQDYELWSRLALRGERFANLPRALLRYRIHGGAGKAKKLRSTLRATLEIKQMYWRERMTRRQRLRMWAERAMLLLPPRLVLWAFTRLYYRPRPRSKAAGSLAEGT